MTRMVMCTLLAAGLLAAGPTGLAGQGVVFGAGGGPAFSLEDGGGTDFHLLGTVRFGGEEGKPISFRADGMLQFADADDLVIGTLNAVYHFTDATDARVRPYVIGGAGIYANGGTDFGINGGAGITVPLGNSPARVFGEARFHAIFAENTINQLPLTVGIMFRPGD